MVTVAVDSQSRLPIDALTQVSRAITMTAPVPLAIHEAWNDPDGRLGVTVANGPFAVESTTLPEQSAPVAHARPEMVTLAPSWACADDGVIEPPGPGASHANVQRSVVFSPVGRFVP